MLGVCSSCVVVRSVRKLDAERTIFTRLTTTFIHGAQITRICSKHIIVVTSAFYWMHGLALIHVWGAVCYWHPSHCISNIFHIKMTCGQTNRHIQWSNKAHSNRLHLGVYSRTIIAKWYCRDLRTSRKKNARLDAGRSQTIRPLIPKTYNTTTTTVSGSCNTIKNIPWPSSGIS